MISLADSQPLKTNLFSSTTRVLQKDISVTKSMPVGWLKSALRGGASFHRLASIIGLKHLHQLSNFVLNIVTLSAKAGSFLQSALPLIPNTANSIWLDTDYWPFLSQLELNHKCNQIQPGDLIQLFPQIASQRIGDRVREHKINKLIVSPNERSTE